MSARTNFHCEACGHKSAKWMGFCTNCGVEEPLVERAMSGSKQSMAAEAVPVRDASKTRSDRLRTGWGEVDRVLGGGFVPGSVVLLGGEPGVGKSTLLLQVANAMGLQGHSTVIATAEESVEQVAMRAERLSLGGESVSLMADDDADAIVSLATQDRPSLVVVDSIQTVGVPEIVAAPGGVSQVRESGARLIRLAKTTGIVVVLVGHVTKDGSLAGPKVLEHMVDVVLSLEGDPDRGFRVLRSNKNRFGPTHVSGMFDMRGDGLVEVDDPSKVFLDGWESSVPGTIVYPAVEGRRSVLVEVQALVASTNQAQPRRSIRGLDPARVNQVIAVLQQHAGLSVTDKEVYVNVVGGWRLDDPGCDLAVALAIASAATGKPLGKLAAWGEVGLAGEVRAVPFQTRRMEELTRMGLVKQIAPGGGEPIRLRGALVEAGLKTN